MDPVVLPLLDEPFECREGGRQLILNFVDIVATLS